jgi:hypothetical protein
MQYSGIKQKTEPQSAQRKSKTEPGHEGKLANKGVRNNSHESMVR